MTAPSALALLDTWGFAAARLMASLLWQAGILLAGAAALDWLLRRRRPAARQRLWLLALALAPLLPLLTGGAQRAGAPQAPMALLPAYRAPAPPPGPPLNPEPAGPAIQAEAAPFDLSPTPSAHLKTTPSGNASASRAPAPVAPALRLTDYPWALGLAAYALGLGYFLALIVLGHLRIRRWIAAATVVQDARTMRAFSDAAGRLGRGRPCPVLEGPGVPAPLTLGLLRPRVLLPRALAEGLGDEELLALALHEQAHGRRRDPLALTLAALARAVLFFHPLVWCAARRIATLAELAADDAVLAATGQPVAYARMLARLAETLPLRPGAAELATGLVPGREAFLRRVEAILGDRSRVRAMTRRGLVATAAALIISLALAVALPLVERGWNNPPDYEKAPASDRNLSIKVGPNTFKVTQVERYRANGVRLMEDGRGHDLNRGGIFSADDAACAPWLDLANISFYADAPSPPAPALPGERYDVIDVRVFDHATKKSIGKGLQGVSWSNENPYGVIRICSLGQKLPDTVDVWLRAYSFADDKGRTRLRPVAGAATPQSENGTVTVREVREGGWSYSRSGGPVVSWGQRHNPESMMTVVLDWAGRGAGGRWQVCAIDRSGQQVLPRYSPQYLEFSGTTSATQVATLPLPLSFVQYLELRPYGERHVFYFDGVRLPGVGERTFTPPPPVTFKFNGAEQELFSEEEAAPLKVSLQTVNGTGVNHVEASPDVVRGRVDPPHDIADGQATFITKVQGVGGVPIGALRLYDRALNPLPDSSFRIFNQNDAHNARDTMRVLSVDKPLFNIGAVELRLGPNPNAEADARLDEAQWKRKAAVRGIRAVTAVGHAADGERLRDTIRPAALLSTRSLTIIPYQQNQRTSDALLLNLSPNPVAAPFYPYPGRSEARTPPLPDRAPGVYNLRLRAIITDRMVKGTLQDLPTTAGLVAVGNSEDDIFLAYARPADLRQGRDGLVRLTLVTPWAAEASTIEFRTNGDPNRNNPFTPVFRSANLLEPRLAAERFFLDRIKYEYGCVDEPATLEKPDDPATAHVRRGADIDR